MWCVVNHGSENTNRTLLEIANEEALYQHGEMFTQNDLDFVQAWVCKRLSK
jgi:hypothetical protein